MNDVNSILVVDDDFNLLEMLRDGLSEHGYQVRVAATPDQAMENVAKNPAQFALIDYDLNVPGTNGVDLAQKIRFQAPNVIIIIMTGYQNIKYAVEAMRTFKFDYMIKPFRIDQVISAFERTLREFELIEENKSLYREILELEEEVKNLRAEVEGEDEPRSLRPGSKIKRNSLSKINAADIYKKQQNM